MVYQAFDTVEGISVALKIPYADLVTEAVLEAFRKEVRLAAKLDHTNILPLKSADFIDGHFVMASTLGDFTLADRLHSRLALRTALDFGVQMIDAVAYAHRHRIIHCDIKPENLIIFEGNRLRLTDFGIAKIAMRTVEASGSGTVGYIAPEQAMGKPSLRSDVFSLGLILYRMLSGRLPEWPFEWPPPGYERLRGRMHDDLIGLVRRAIQVDPKKRFQDAGYMLTAFQKVKVRALRHSMRRGRRRNTNTNTKKVDWKLVRQQQFQRQYNRMLETRHRCHHCDGPVSEYMHVCPWCGSSRKVHRGETQFPDRCPRCKRGMKLDWRYCPWCFGPGFQTVANREYSDVRYEARCTNLRCLRKQLMPFMRYCP